MVFVCPWLDFNSEIMQSGICSKKLFNEPVCLESAFFFYNSHEPDTSDGIFDPYSYARNFPVEFFLFFSKFLATFFLDRLYNLRLFRCISLIVGILTGYKELVKNTLCLPSFYHVFYRKWFD